MSISIYKKCPVCDGSIRKAEYNPDFDWTFVDCLTCGRFNLTTKAHETFDLDKLASYLFYKKTYDEAKKRSVVYTVCTREDTNPTDNAIIPRMVEGWFPETFSEKVDQFLLALDCQSFCLGFEITFFDSDLHSACFVKRCLLNAFGDGYTEKEQSDFLLNYLISQQYITYGKSTTKINIALAPKGIQRIDELQKTNPNNRDIFIAISFSRKNYEIKEAIKRGISDAGYNPIIMSDMIHGKQIIPMMFRLIRESQYLVMDATDPNYGAYHEAGYALGLGKEVIITCREEEFNDENNRPHFDIAQKQILVWKDYEDLTLQLSEWIKAIAG